MAHTTSTTGPNWTETARQAVDSAALLLDADLKVQGWNHTMIGWLNRQPELQNIPLFDLIAPQDHAAINQILIDLREGRNFSGHFSDVTWVAAQTRRSVTLHFSIMATQRHYPTLILCHLTPNQEDPPLSVQSTENERQLREQIQRLERALNDKNHFFTLIHRNLREPLAGTINLLEAIHAEQLLPGPLQQACEQAQANLDNLLEIAEDRDRPSRLHLDALSPAFGFINARHLIDQVTRSLNTQAEEQHITLKNEIDPLQRLHGDPYLLDEAFRHLINLAIELSNAGESVPILFEEGGISIRSSGLAKHIEALSRQLQPSLVVDKLATAMESDTLCQAIIAAHDGEIRLRTLPGSGGEVAIVLPESEPIILLVDDSEIERMLLRPALEQIGLDVHEANDGAEALQMIEKQRPDLIVSDLRMPKLDGFELLSKLKETPVHESIPTIVLTVDQESETRTEAFHLGAVDFVNKPIQFHDLIPRIRRFLG
ncbi:response regulator [Magnetococcus sp. PR-3]|uniref:response regulator n=1 Tax=Magnetococcus sp. PR-3 TaxID=3120355 RepID=UPI002FCE666D